MEQNQVQISSDMPNCTPISSLYPNMTNYMLRVRVTKKNLLKKVQRQDGKEFSVFSIDLIDSEGSEITCHFYEQVAEKYFEQIEQDKVYEITGAYVKLLNNKLYNKGEDYLLTFDRGATIKSIDDDNNIQRQKFEFKQIDQILSFPHQFELDICGIVKQKEIRLQKLKDGKEVEIMNLEIFDQSQKTIKVNLWDKKFTEIQIETDDIVAIKSLRVLEFQNRKELTSTFKTLVFVNMESPEISAIKTWVQENEQSIKPVPLYDIPQYNNNQNINSSFNNNQNKNSSISNQNGQSGENNQNIHLYNVSCINQIINDAQNANDKSKKIYTNLRVHIDYIKPDGQIYYLSCSQDDCQKKATQIDDAGNYSCPKHGQIQNPIPKFMTSVKVIDSTGSIHAQLFGHIGQQIFQIDEQEVRDWVEKQDLAAYREYMSRIHFQEFLVTIMSKFDQYQGEYKVRHQIIKVFPQLPQAEGMLLIKQILQYPETQQI